METFNMLLQGFYISITSANLLACVSGVFIGTFVGVLPGIGPLGAIALLLPFSAKMNVTSSLIMFAGIVHGAMFGGATSAILLNIPGKASSIVLCKDGHQMAKKGRGGAALAIAAISSFIAGTLGLIGLTFCAPILANFALLFGPSECFATAILGLVMLTKLTGNSMIKSALMVTIGIMIGTIGLDSLTGIARFSFEVDELQRGIDLVIVAMGVYGISEVIDVMTQINLKVQPQSIRFKELYPNKEEIRRSIAPIFRGGVIGFCVGLIPGPALVIPSFISYALEKRISKHPEEFGRGAIEGVVGPESANNAASSSLMIPLLSLGLPFCGVSAIMLSGFTIHGITPGPTLITEHPDLFWGLIASMYIGNVLLLIINLPLIGIFTTLLRIPVNILMPIVFMIIIIGVYSINNSFFDLWLLIIFGIFGFFMKRTGYEPAPLIIGLVLGPILERGLIQALIINDGNLLTFFMRPISGTILMLAFLLIIYNVVKWIFKYNHIGKKMQT
jgi:putative tricarboxylic transport membrane protein